MQRLSFPGSTALQGATYDPTTETLTITFMSGSSYSYPNVPPDVVEQLAEAPSAGSFWRNNIKDQY
jgi:hypothetical protein